MAALHKGRRSMGSRRLGGSPPHLPFVLSDVVQTMPIVVIAPNEAIKVIPLPYGAPGTNDSANLFRGKALPAVENPRQLDSVEQFQQHMHMIGHDDVGMKDIPLAIEILQCVGNNAIAITSRKNTCTMPSVKPFFNVSLELTRVFLRRYVIPWFWMGGEPRFSLAAPFGKQFRWHRICKTERYEHDHAALTQVWKIVPTDVGLCNV